MVISPIATVTILITIIKTIIIFLFNFYHAMHYSAKRGLAIAWHP